MGGSGTAGGGLDPFSYSSGVMTGLGNLGVPFAYATGINASGQIVGSSPTAGNASEDPVLYSGGVMTDLGTFGGTSGAANGINASGQIVGYSSTAGNASTDPFL